MRISVMQPYLFPYIGYFCLINSSDTFIFYDDVNYIPRGWINRNRVLSNGQIQTFVMPVKNGSQNKLIKEVRLDSLQYNKNKFIKKIHSAYGRSKRFDYVIDYIERTFDIEDDLVGTLSQRSVEIALNLLGIQKNIIKSSENFKETSGVKGASRIIEIAHLIGSKNYINPIGGACLYDKKIFKDAGIDLNFLEPQIVAYPQPSCIRFIPNLSIIDLLMNIDLCDIKKMINLYRLV